MVVEAVVVKYRWQTTDSIVIGGWYINLGVFLGRLRPVNAMIDRFTSVGYTPALPGYPLMSLGAARWIQSQQAVGAPVA